jgi:hypothetical protein
MQRSRTIEHDEHHNNIHIHDYWWSGKARLGGLQCERDDGPRFEGQDRDAIESGYPKAELVVERLFTGQRQPVALAGLRWRE